MTNERTAFFGIDFSGADAPGRSIWIAEGTATGGELTVQSVQSARDRFECRGRASILEKLRALVRSHNAGIFALDFPFGLPTAVHETPDETGWEEFVEDFTDTFGNDDDDATEFRTDCAERAGGEGRAYVRRETDWRRAGQCPYGNQIQYQTYFGLSQLLKPLIAEGNAVALPMQQPVADKPWLIETYPAAVFGSLGLYRTGYKNHHPNSEHRRAANVDGIERETDLEFGSSVHDAAVASDDALDSLACLYAAHTTEGNEIESSEESRLEGWIHI